MIGATFYSDEPYEYALDLYMGAAPAAPTLSLSVWTRMALANPITFSHHGVILLH